MLSCKKHPQKSNTLRRCFYCNKVLAYDIDIDLAVLQVNATNLTPVTIQENFVLSEMQVYAMGSSEGYII